MDPNPIHQTIAGQIDHMRPDRLQPGRDVLMAVVDARTLRVLVVTGDDDGFATFDIAYDEGADLYRVTKEDEELERVFCDDLGRILFGDEAKPWTLPHGGISTDGGQTWETF